MPVETVQTRETRTPAVDWFGPAAERERQAQPQPEEFKLPLGPLKVVHAYWLAGMSCDGCSIAAVGATSPPVEDLLAGAIPGIPKVVLHHPVLSVEAGEEFVRNYELAEQGELGAPYVVIYEGSVADERRAASTGGYWAALGVEKGQSASPRPIPTAEWLRRLAPGAAAVLAIGTCATWGGIPAAAGNPTGAMGVMDFLGEGYRSAYGLPVINIPGCSPVGDNFTETVAAILLFLQGLGPLPEFDALGRPAWLFGETVHRKCVRAGYYEEGVFARKFGDEECLVTVGCWGPVVNCNITSRGAINHMGGCMNTGGVCIGCTMPGFPDRFAPFYTKPPGSTLSTAGSRLLGTFIRPLRRFTQQFQNREPRWDEQKHVPSGWGHVPEAGPVKRFFHYLYQKYQFLGSRDPSMRRASPEHEHVERKSEQEQRGGV
jgi:hydrogenase small subunit